METEGREKVPGKDQGCRAFDCSHHGGSMIDYLLSISIGQIEDTSGT